ncbi:MAG: hypothetical protein BRD57_02365 [Proteobacteria bacterium SW_6_67_9]|nr:MAG: hypothetical protein BRD57_02365 [Proteobacteria bacterium SW_6_67_9]
MAKLNRADDRFNDARIEHVCLDLARAAGLNAPASHLIDTDDSDALLVQRFDVTPSGGRRHVISANALLKNTTRQVDPIQPRYDDLAALVRHYSVSPKADLKQLFGQMLLNEAINNVDDHPRNFSFVHTDRGLRLSPAYHLVADDALGGYPNLTLGTRSRRPRPDDRRLTEAAETLSLAPREARTVARDVSEALSTLPSIAAQAGLEDRDWRIMRRVMWQPQGSTDDPLNKPGSGPTPTPSG